MLIAKIIIVAYAIIIIGAAVVKSTRINDRIIKTFWLASHQTTYVFGLLNRLIFFTVVSFIGIVIIIAIIPRKITGKINIMNILPFNIVVTLNIIRIIFISISSAFILRDTTIFFIRIFIISMKRSWTAFIDCIIFIITSIANRNIALPVYINCSVVVVIINAIKIIASIQRNDYFNNIFICT